MNEPNNKSVQIFTDSDYAFAQKLVNFEPMLVQFWKTATCVLDTEEQNKRIEIKANAYPFLVKDINITAYSQYGNFFLNGQSRDLITVSFKSGAGDDFFMDEGIDISNFLVSRNKRITPFLIPANSNIVIELKHSRAVGGFVAEFPTPGQTTSNLFFAGGLPTTVSPFPLRLQVSFDGAKLYKEGDRR